MENGCLLLSASALKYPFFSHSLYNFSSKSTDNGKKSIPSFGSFEATTFTNTTYFTKSTASKAPIKVTPKATPLNIKPTFASFLSSASFILSVT